MILKNCTFFNENFEKEYGDIEIENGKIKQIGILDGDGKDMAGKIIIPGFIDVHIHGCAGGDASDADKSGLEKMAKELAKHGVTSFCPTSMTLPKERLESIVKAIKEFKEESHGGAKVMGINLEGPFIAMSKKGAQNAEYVRGGTIEEFDDLYAKAASLLSLLPLHPKHLTVKNL